MTKDIPKYKTICISETISELRKKEFSKILKHKAEGKPFTAKWTLVRI